MTPGTRVRSKHTHFRGLILHVRDGLARVLWDGADKTSLHEFSELSEV